MNSLNPYRWCIRLILVVGLAFVTPSAPCAMEYAVPQTDWARTVSWLSGTDRKSAEEALYLVSRGDSGLALVRLDTSGQRGRGPLSTARVLSAWLLAETAHTLGALPPAAGRAA